MNDKPAACTESRTRCGACKHRRTVVAIALTLTLAPALASAADADWLRCKDLRDDAKRLACYDAQAAALSPAAAQSGFGLVTRSPEPEPEAIESSLAEVIDGWEAGSRIRLANGQVWQIADGSSGFLRSSTRKVRIRRGAFGAFYMEFEGSNRSPRVKRLQ